MGGARKKFLFGLRFEDAALAGREVRPFLTAEAGSCLFEEGILVGFVVPHGKAQKTYSLFDVSGKRLAVAARDDTGFQVHAKTERAGSLPSFHVSSLFDAACRSINTQEPLTLEPAISNWRLDLSSPPKTEAPAPTPTPAATPGRDEPPKAAPPQAPAKDARGRPVKGPKGSLGFLCETELPKSWLVTDRDGRQIAYIAGVDDSSEYRVVSMGDSIDDELEFELFASLESSLAAAFQVASVEIGELATVGKVTPVEVKDSASSVDLKPGAVKVTLEGFHSLEEWAQPRKAPNTTRATAKHTRPRISKDSKSQSGLRDSKSGVRDTKSRPRATGKLTRRGQVNRVGRAAAGVVLLVMLGGLLYGFGLLVRAYTS